MVTDDIVARLREEVAKAEVAGVLPNWELAKCMWEAADEIEGLRAENRRLHLSLMVAYSEAAGMYDDRNEANHD